MKPNRSPIKWPEGARIAITPCVAFETWPEDLGAPGTMQNENRRPFPKSAVTKKNLCVISEREYGERAGVFRILELFHKEGIKTTFFPTGITVANYPEIFHAIVGEGHEIGTETWIHDYSFMKTRAQEKKDLEKTVKAVQDAVGEAPRGYLSTGIAPSENTPEIILELGYTYWMDPQHEDTPYTLRLNGGELTVLSYDLYLNDYSTYKFTERSPRDLLQIWKDTFDYLYEEGATDPKFMIWGNHPFLSGRAYRAIIHREFIRYAKSHAKVWFARAGDMARWYRENYRHAQVEEWPNFTIAGRHAKRGDLQKLR
jgi:peptidoglycan/xylan/chitin deacetylase (PgdA/CDA1 family)